MSKKLIITIIKVVTGYDMIEWAAEIITSKKHKEAMRNLAEEYSKVAEDSYEYVIKARQEGMEEAVKSFELLIGCKDEWTREQLLEEIRNYMKTNKGSGE